MGGGERGEIRRRVKRCDLERRGHCADRYEGTAIAVPKTRCQICCEVSPGLGCGGQRGTVAIRNRPGTIASHFDNTNTHRHTHTHTHMLEVFGADPLQAQRWWFVFLGDRVPPGIHLPSCGS